MNGIKMSDCRFYVNEEERTVVCVIPNTKYMVTEFISGHFRWNDIDFDMALGYRYSEKELHMPCSFMGKAVCAPEDKWDVETGKLIAFVRAKDKCYKSFFKRATRFVNTIDSRVENIMTIFNDFGRKLENKNSALLQKIEEQIIPAKEE